MRVDVVDRRAVGHARVLQRDLDRLDRAGPGRIRRRDVVGVARRAVARELGVGLCAARPRVLLAFENQHRRALAHDEAVAALGERTAARLRRVVVVRREGLHLHEAADRELGDGRLGPARDDDVGAARADHVEREAKGVRRGRARRHDDLRRALRAERDGDVARRLVRNQLGNRERRDAVRPAVEEDLVVVARHVQPADAVADQDADAIHVGLRLGRVARVLPRLDRRRDRILREERHVPRLALVQEPAVDGVGREVLHLARDLRRAAGRVELRDPADAGLARLEVGPGGSLAVAARAEHADAGDHHFLHLVGSFRV